MEKKLVIFDLDGTLLDTSPGIIESVKYAADKLGYAQLSMEKMLSFVGPPLRVSFMRCYECGEDETENLTDAFREKYIAGAMLNAVPYEGIFDLCDELKQNGYTLGVATGKAQQYAEQLLEHFGFDEYLDIICGTDMEGKLTKADIIRKCMETAGAAEDECIMIGDTEYDAKGAAEAGVPFLAVTYGFGNQDEMLSYPNIGIVDTPREVSGIL